MKRLAAMQLWPLFWTRAVTPTRTAPSRSADGSTTKGSLPPSSRTDFLMARPAVSATDRPASSDPVRVTARTRWSSMTPATRPARDEQGLEDAGGEPGPAEEVLDEQRRLGDVRGVLEQTDVAGHEGGGGEAHHLPEGEVPGHDGQDRAHGPVEDPAVAGVGRRPSRRPGTPRRARRTSAAPWRTWPPPPWPRRRSCPSRWS